MEEKKINNEITIDEKLAQAEDKYLRLYAEFENYKKRLLKEKEELATNVKISMLTPILDMDNDISIAIKNITDDTARQGVELIAAKLSNFLKSYNIESIQTDTYDADLHEVINVVDTGKQGIFEVASKGYTINGKPFRYPKIILSK